jgi:hypothetical protein
MQINKLVMEPSKISEQNKVDQQCKFGNQTQQNVRKINKSKNAMKPTNELTRRTRINITLETQYPQISVQNKVHELEM